jgi:ribosome-binding protein aMBF1 (putative translation factor)
MNDHVMNDHANDGMNDDADGSDPRVADAVLGTLTAEEQRALAAWLEAQGVRPHRRGMRPRAWVPLDPPEAGWVLQAPLAPGVRPVYVLTPDRIGRGRRAVTADPDAHLFPITESQAAHAARLRRQRAARAARGEPEPEPAHERRLRERLAAARAAQALGAAVRAWRRAHGVTQTELALRLGMAQPNVGRLERGEVSPGLGMLQRLAAATGGEVRLAVRDAHIAVEVTEAPPPAA